MSGFADWLMDSFAGFMVFVFGGCALLFVIIGAVIVGISWPVSEASCNQEAQTLGVQGDYKLMSNECFLTLENGQVVPLSNYRFNHHVKGDK